MKEELERLLRRDGVPAEPASALATYGAMLLQANTRASLTGAKTPRELAAHLEDSLTLEPYVSSPLVDVGSGGGLPAIPLAVGTGVAITLIESNGKKAHFLSTTIAALGLHGEVVPSRAEEAAHEERLRERFACGTCRAVGAATTAAELLLPFIEVGGVALLQRANMSRAELSALSDATLVLGGELERVLTLGERRCVAMLRKKIPTPPRFPRRTGVPAKRPLCRSVSRET